MLFVAAAIIVVLALAHSYLGERYLLIRLFRRSEHLPPLLGGTDFTKNTLRFIWHLVSVMALGFALLLVQIAGHASLAAITSMIGAALVVSGILPLVFTRGRHLSWVGMFAAGALCLAWAVG